MNSFWFKPQTPDPRPQTPTNKMSYIPCLGQQPQLYYSLYDNGQTARCLVLKLFIGNCNKANSRYKDCFCILESPKKIQIDRTGSTLFIVRTDSHEIICPVKDRLTRNYIPCLEQRVLPCVAPIASQFHSACLRAPTQYCP